MRAGRARKAHRLNDSASITYQGVKTMSRIIAVIVKVAGLVITAPVTWNVAELVFADVGSGSLRLLVQVSALAVVEGVFLASWLALDGDKTAPDPVKVRHVITTLAMCLDLWVLTIQHGEDLALARSIYDAGIVSALRRDTAERDAAKEVQPVSHVSLR